MPAKGKLAKGKGREKPPPKGTLTKTEKLPLQDITSRFAPAYAPTNRGEDVPREEEAQEPREGSVVASPSPLDPSGSTLVQPPAASRTRLTSNAIATARPAAATATYPSSLPPSSPPSVSSIGPAPQQPLLPTLQDEEGDPSDLPLLPPSPVLPNVNRRLFTHVESADEDRPYNPWNEFDDVVRSDEDATRSQVAPRQHRTSDPFGFFALEEKLEAEREEQHAEDEEIAGDATIIEEDEVDDEEAGGEILVADTSSPRPVRRLRHKHKYVIEAVLPDSLGAGEGGEEGTPRLPPTPVKTVDRRRFSYGAVAVMDDEQLFSPHASSCASSPSPLKRRTELQDVYASPTAIGKRKAVLEEQDADEDPYEEETSLSDLGTPSQKVPGRKQARVGAEEGSVVGVQTRRQLRSRTVGVQHQKEETASTSVVDMKKTAATTTRKSRTTKGEEKKGAKAKGKSSKSKKESNNVQEESDMEQWERERQKRLEYFKELEEYDYETENVYVV